VAEFLSLAQQCEANQQLPITTCLINTAVVDLLETSSSPADHLEDILRNSNINFEASSQTVFIHPGLLNFQAIAELVDLVATFYIGYNPAVNVMEMADILADCATPALGKEWPETSSMMATGDDDAQTCGDRLRTLFETFILQRDPLAAPSSCLDETQAMTHQSKKCSGFSSDASSSYVKV
jgi:hypothetical protein